MASGMVQPLAKPREQVKHALQCPARRAIHPRPVKGCQILGHAEIGEDLAALRHQPDAGAGKFERVAVCRRVAEAGDRPAGQRQLSHDGADGGRLAHAVAPHQRHAGAGLYGKADAEQYLRRPVSGLDPVKPQHHHPLRDRPPAPRRPRRSGRARRWRSPHPRQALSPGRQAGRQHPCHARSAGSRPHREAAR